MKSLVAQKPWIFSSTLVGAGRGFIFSLDPRERGERELRKPEETKKKTIEIIVRIRKRRDSHLNFFSLENLLESANMTMDKMMKKIIMKGSNFF